jgi:hypothetical protein
MSEPPYSSGAFPDRHRVTLEGTFRIAFEVYTFTQCGHSEPWWLDFTPECDVAPGALTSEDLRRLRMSQGDIRLYGVFEGLVSRQGSYGHNG